MLPRLELDGGVPESGRTMVIVPTLLGSVQAVDELLAHLEIQALGNLDPRIHFALLSDFTDALSEHRPEDADILAARAGGHRRAERAPSQPPRQPLLLVPPRSAVEREGRDVDGMGAQARQDRGVQPPASRRRATPDSTRRGRSVDSGRRAVLHHARHRHAAAARRRQDADRHRAAPAQPAERRSRRCGG